MAILSIINTQGKQAEKLEVSDEIFSGRVNTDVIHQAVVMYQACQRQGNAATKERAYVSGGGKKPWAQKGTGRARQGSSRSPLWVGGGVTFGPHPRDFSYSVSKRIRKAALRESLNAKYQAKDICCISDFKDKFTKTKEFAKLLTTLNLKGKVLALLDGCDASVRLVSRNIPRFELMRVDDVNAYDVLRSKTVLLTKTAFNKLLKRIA